MADRRLHNLLRLTLTPGLGPIRISRLIELFGDPEAILSASPQSLERLRGIGAARARAIVQGLRESARLADEELTLAERLNVRLVTKDDADYPHLLAPLPDAPHLLYMQGQLLPGDLDAYPVAIVGSRRATAYGIEQAERFAGVLGRAGLTIVSGGARGIDTAAHRGALRAGGRTVAILGCGLAKCYPPENAELFARVADGRAGRGGAIISELPLNTSPEADNFPARNRLISGMCLGVIVIEAGKKSGSLITARVATDEQGREVMAVPGRVDSAASVGTHELLKEGAAALVTEPADVLANLESAARHVHGGTHVHRYAVHEKPAIFDEAQVEGKPDWIGRAGEKEPKGGGVAGLPLTPSQQAILSALAEPSTTDDLVRTTGLSAATVRSEVTILEIQRRIVRKGGHFARG